MNARLFLATLAIVLGFSQAAYAGDVSVTLNGVRNGTGTMRLALYNNAQDFPNGSKFMQLDIPAVAGSMAAVFDGVPPGRYAIAVLHDENNNSKMDTGMLGLPEEGYGFSRDAPALLSPPSFDSAAFSVAEEGVSLTITLDY